MASSSQTVKLPKASSPVSQSIPGIIRPWLWWLEPHGGRLGGDLIYMLCVPLWWPFNVEMACGCPEYLTIVLKCLNIVVQECAKPNWGHPIHILYPFRSSKPRSPPLVLGIMLKKLSLPLRWFLWKLSEKPWIYWLIIIQFTRENLHFSGIPHLQTRPNQVIVGDLSIFIPFYPLKVVPSHFKSCFTKPMN